MFVGPLCQPWTAFFQIFFNVREKQTLMSLSHCYCGLL